MTQTKSIKLHLVSFHCERLHEAKYSVRRWKQDGEDQSAAVSQCTDQQTGEVDLTEIYCANNPEHIVKSKPNQTQGDGLTDSSSMLAWKHSKRLFDIQSVSCV